MGLTVVDPLAEVEVKLPGVIAIVVAPLVDQLSVALDLELMPVGFAENEEIVGIVVFPEAELDAPQLTNTAEASRIRTRAKTSALNPPSSRAF